MPSQTGCICLNGLMATARSWNTLGKIFDFDFSSAYEMSPMLIDRLVERTRNLIECVFDFIEEPIAFNADHHMLHFNITQRMRSATIRP